MADPLEDQMAAAIRDAVRLVRDKMVEREVENALAAGDIEGALDAVRMELGEAMLADTIPQSLRTAYERAALTARDSLRNHSEAVSFDLLNPESMSWIRARAAELINEFGSSSLRAIRGFINRAYRRGETPAELARTIRESGIGLTERQITAVDNFRIAMENSTEDFTAAQVEARVTAYAERALRQRARLIARTEILRAEGEGNRALWREALRRGLIDARAEVEWQTTGQENVCPECDGLEGETVNIGELFSAGVEGPPLHPACSCVAILHPLGAA